MFCEKFKGTTHPMGNCNLKLPSGGDAVEAVPYGSAVRNPFTNTSVTCPRWWGGFMYPNGCCAVTEQAKKVIMEDPRVTGATGDDAKHCAMLEVAAELKLFTGEKPAKCGP